MSMHLSSLAILQQALARGALTTADRIAPRAGPPTRITRLTPDATRHVIPDLSVESRANPYPPRDPLAPSRAACAALARRYVSPGVNDAIARIMSEATDQFCASDFTPELLSAGAILGVVMLETCRRGISPTARSTISNSARLQSGQSALIRLRTDCMAFAMLRVERHGKADGQPCQDWHLYELGFTREEVFDLGWEAAQIAEAIGRVIAEMRS